LNNNVLMITNFYTIDHFSSKLNFVIPKTKISYEKVNNIKRVINESNSLDTVKSR